MMRITGEHIPPFGGEGSSPETQQAIEEMFRLENSKPGLFVAGIITGLDHTQDESHQVTEEIPGEGAAVIEGIVENTVPNSKDIGTVHQRILAERKSQMGHLRPFLT